MKTYNNVPLLMLPATQGKYHHTAGRFCFGLMFGFANKTISMIKRDGYKRSLWQDNIQPYNKQHIFSPATDYDVIIVGGGITGVSTALLLQEAGRNCLLLDSHNLCFGTTGGTTAHLNTLL